MLTYIRFIFSLLLCLLSTLLHSAETARFEYDALGRRTLKETHDLCHRYAWDTTLYGYVFDPNIQIDPFGLDILYHYTNPSGMEGILQTKVIKPSLKELNPKDVRYGNGQHLSDIIPGTKTPSQLGRQFINVPNKHKYTHYVAIDVSGLDVIKGRDGVFVVRGDTDLDISYRIIGSGKIKCGG